MAKLDVVMRAVNITKHFGGLSALNDVSIEIERGSITALIGPNGAGKTTLFNVLTGFIRPSSGRVLYGEKDITFAAPNRISMLGISRTFQITRVFPGLTVLENAMFGCNPVRGESPITAVFRRGFAREEEKRNSEKALANLDTLGLIQYRDELAGNLGYAQRKLLEIARVLTSEPNLVLLDEPFSGIFGEMMRKMIGILLALKRAGKTILLIEHNMSVVMEISERVFVLDHGELLASGTPDEIRSDERVIEAYLGRG